MHMEWMGACCGTQAAGCMQQGACAASIEHTNRLHWTDRHKEIKSKVKPERDWWNAKWNHEHSDTRDVRTVKVGQPGLYNLLGG